MIFVIKNGRESLLYFLLRLALAYICLNNFGAQFFIVHNLTLLFSKATLIHSIGWFESNSHFSCNSALLTYRFISSKVLLSLTIIAMSLHGVGPQ